MIRTGDDDMTPGGNAPRRNEVGQRILQALDGGQPILSNRSEAIETLGQHVGEGREVALHRGAFLPALVDHLHEGAEADGDQEGDDEGRHGAAKRRLGCQQPVIGRFCDRLRQSLDRIGLDAHVRRVRTRHALDPRNKNFAQCPEGTPRRFRIKTI